MKQTIKPWSDTVLVSNPPEEKTEQGVILNAGSDSTDPNKRPDKGIVVAVGKPSEAKNKLPIPLEAGDMIMFERYTKNPITHQGKEYNFVRFRTIMGVVKKEDIK